MAANPMMWATLDPSSSGSLAGLQLQQQIASALLQKGLQADNGTQMAGGVAIRKSPLEYLANIANVYSGKSGLEDSTKKIDALNRQAYARMLGIPQMGDPNQGPQPEQPPMTAQVLAQGAQNGSVGPTNTNAQALATALQQPPTQQAAPSAGQTATSAPMAPGGSMNPMGMSPQLAAMALMSDPSKYAELQAGAYKPTDATMMARQGNVDPVAANRAALNKANYIAPTSVRPGGGLYDPKTGNITTMPPMAPPGSQAVQLADGSWGYMPVRGGTAAVTAGAAATEQGKAPYQILEGFDEEKKAPVRNYAGNVLPLPGQQTMPQPGRKGSPEANAQGYTSDSLTILQNELKAEQAKKPADADGLARQQANIAGLQREIASVQPRVSGFQSGPALGQAQGATNAQNEMSDAWKAQQTAHQASQTNVALLQNLKQLADKAVTGYEPDRRTYVQKLLAYSGINGADEKASATDLLNKYSAQIIAGLSQKGGMSTDAARELVMAGSPNSHMQASAIKEASDGLISREQMTQARTAVLQQFANKRDAAGFQQAASQFDQAADPRLWQLKAMNPQQAQTFLGKMPADVKVDLAKRAAALKQAGVL